MAKSPKVYTFKIKVRGKIFDVTVKPMFRLKGWDLAWVKVKKVLED
jgi:hypothetical protein